MNFDNMIIHDGFLNSAIALSKGDDCGEDNWIGKIIPDYYPFCKISLKPACKPHDYDYLIGTTDREKVQADIYFFANLLILLLKLNKERLKFLCDALMQRLEKAYTTQKTNEVWKDFFNQIENNVSDLKMNWFKKWIRYKFAKKYWQAVDIYGYIPYWKNKTVAYT